MSHINIRINTDNDIFTSNYDAEVARILRSLSERVEYGAKDEYIPVKDINGNKIGEFFSFAD